MGNSNEFYENLKKVHKIKKKEIRIYKRKENIPSNQTIRETSLLKGSVWGVPDESVPFDKKRKDDDYKDALRPSLVLETPNNFGNNHFVKLAPGTSKYHPHNETNNLCLLASVPPEELKQSTYFLIYFSWNAVQKNLQNRFCELSTSSKERISILMRELVNEKR